MYADGVESEVIYDVNSRKLLYVEKGICKEIEDLSAGYQSILSLIIDLAYRISVLNPDIGDNISKVEGIVLIDEIDSNLHPKWQWKIVEAITQIFQMFNLLQLRILQLLYHLVRMLIL